MKIGRNDACPCGSGKKYKRCCAGKSVTSADPIRQEESKPQKRTTLGEVISSMQQRAAEKKEMVQQIGVFLLYADGNGDAWVLELTDSDCIQIAAEGEPLDVPLEEDEETIIIDWSHQFSFKNKALQIISYKDKKTEILAAAPSQQLFAIRRKILKKLSPDQIDQVHLDK